MEHERGDRMTNTIEALWNGELAFCEHCGAYDQRANELVARMARSRDRLCEGLTEEQKEVFQSYVDQSEAYVLRMMELAFCDGFSVAARLLTEGLYGG